MGNELTQLSAADELSSGSISENLMENIESVDLEDAGEFSLGLMEKSDEESDDSSNDESVHHEKIEDGEYLIQIDVKVDSKIKGYIPYHTWMSFSVFGNVGKLGEYHRGIGMMEKDGFGVGAVKNRKATIDNKEEDEDRPFANIARIKFISRRNLIIERNLNGIGKSTIEVMKKYGSYNIKKNNCRTYVDIFLSILFGSARMYTNILLDLKVSHNHMENQKLSDWTKELFVEEYYILPTFYFGVQKTCGLFAKTCRVIKEIIDDQNEEGIIPSFFKKEYHESAAELIDPEDVSERKMDFFKFSDKPLHGRTVHRITERKRVDKRKILRNVQCGRFNPFF